jgi:hypothetical protein
MANELTVKRYDLGREDLPIYECTVTDLGDRSVIRLPDGRVGTIPTRPAARGTVFGATVLSKIEYRLCGWDKDSVQVLGYELEDGSPPSFTGCPVLQFTETGHQA